MRKPLMILVAVLLGVLLTAPQAQAFKPDIRYVVATDDTNGIRFTAKVRMDKTGARSERRVWVTYKGERKRARHLYGPPLSHYETREFSIPVRKCYRVEVKARNEYGVTKRTMRAGMLGTNGCG